MIIVNKLSKCLTVYYQQVKAVSISLCLVLCAVSISPQLKTKKDLQPLTASQQLNKGVTVMPYMKYGYWYVTGCNIQFVTEDEALEYIADHN